MVVDLASHLAEPIPIDAASGTVIWRRSGDRITVLSDNIAISNADLDSQSNIQVTLDEGEAPEIDLVSRWGITDIGSAKRFIPGKLMHSKLYDWFQDALVSGSIPSGTTRLHGPLDKFPFDGGEGRFLLEANVRDTTFKFLPDWPAAEIIDMDVVLDNTRLYTERNRSVNRGREVVDAKVEIDDLRKPVLTIDSYSTGTLESLHSYVQSSPLAKLFGGHLRRIRVAGDAALNLDLMVPITESGNFTVTARIVANDAGVQVEGFDPPVTALNGVVTIDRTSVTSEALGGTFLGRPVEIAVDNAPPDLPRFQVVARARGAVDAQGLSAGLGLPVAGLVRGEADYVVDLLFPRGNSDEPTPFTVRVGSDLVGMEVGLPEPFLKPAAEVANVSGDIAFLPGGQRIESRGTADGGVSWNIAFARDGDTWDLERGVLALGGGELQAAETRGLHIRGNVESIRFDEWLQLSRGDEQRTGTADRIRSVDVNVDSLRVLGQHLRNHRVRVDRSARDWLVQFEGEQVTGSVFVPYEFGSGRAVTLDMERLVLPGDDAAPDAAAERAEVDPRTLPPITLKAAEFALGNRFLGALDMQLARTDEGLVADAFVARDASFAVVGNARWVADATDPSGFRSHLMATLTSTDVTETMQRLDYAPGIDGNDMTLMFDVSWSGGPRTDVFASLDGDVQVRFGAGQLNEIEPGAGRLFGLMSIVALPRRLSLDFTDVFDKGFGFDALDGTFRIVDGEAYTCDLSLEGPAANIAIIGRASLTAREYEQTAVVAANFGNTLPVVGAVVAGPQIAAALLIFSQIFKKPLQEMGQVYYAIDGSWDDPAIESTNAASFASRAELAGCILESE
ncbi:MAG TPA: AsmA-like C-terminal region-containing protein, partial [Woeseiaceae bacterium]|nr:AsmA-like C-terminal region-containing protein [Woeseiaceae bacterium]